LELQDDFFNERGTNEVEFDAVKATFNRKNDLGKSQNIFIKLSLFNIVVCVKKVRIEMKVFMITIKDIETVNVKMIQINIPLLFLKMRMRFLNLIIAKKRVHVWN